MNPHNPPQGITTRLGSLSDAAETLRQQGKGKLKPQWRLRYLDRAGIIHEPDHLDWEVYNANFGRLFSTIHTRIEDGNEFLGWDQYAITEGPSGGSGESTWGAADTRAPGAIVVPYLVLPNANEPLVVFVRRGRPHAGLPPLRTGLAHNLWFLEVPRGFNSGVSETAVEAALRELIEEIGNMPQLANFSKLHLSTPRFISYINPNTAFYTSPIAVFCCELTRDQKYAAHPSIPPDELESTLLAKGRLMRPSQWFKECARDLGNSETPAVVGCGLTAASLFLFTQHYAAMKAAATSS